MRTLSIDPLHPVTRGSARLDLELDGERIIEAAVDVGYLHRGFEKECEDGSWSQAIPYTDRLSYQSAVLSSTAYGLAVETLLGCELPPRALWLRVLAGELARIADHLTRLSDTCMGLGAVTPFMYGMEAREVVWDLQEALTGGRVTSGYVCIGGVVRDTPEGYESRLESDLSRLERMLLRFDRVAARHRIFVDRLRMTGAVPRDRLVELAITGPLLRAAGIPYDVRKAQPYLVYDELDFDVPVGAVGDNYDRFLVCQEEIVQSLRIVDQCRRALDGGRGEPIRAEGFGAVEPEPGAASGPSEWPPVPAGETYQAVESANGELGFYVISDGTAKPWKVRCRPPSFIHAAALHEMLRGGMLSDVIPTFGLVNSVGGECDR